MARSAWSVRANAPPRALSALMRSARVVLSLSISAPQSATILSSPPAAIAARQGAGSTGGSFSTPVPVACAGARQAPASIATAADNNKAFNTRRIPENRNMLLWHDTARTAKAQPIISVDFDARFDATQFRVKATLRVDRHGTAVRDHSDVHDPAGLFRCFRPADHHAWQHAAPRRGRST